MRKNKKIIVMLILVIINIAVITNTILAVTTGSFSISSKTKTMNPGDTTTLTINVNNCEGQFSIKSSNSDIVSVSSKSEWVDSNGKTITLTAKATGTATITVTAENVGDNQAEPEDVTGSKTITITVKAKETTPPSDGGSTGGSTGGTTGGSTGGTTGSTTGGTTSGESTTNTPTKPTFKDVSKTVYATGDINLRSSWSTSSAATSIAKGTELKLTGTSTEKINGYVWYRVTYNGQIKYVSKDLITETKPEEEKSNNVNLKILAIEDVKLTPEFSNEITEYSAKLTEFEGTQLNIIAEAEDEKSNVKIEGNTNIEYGENTITITVTAEDGTTKVYTIKVEKVKTETFGLSSLIIKDVELQGFSTEKYEYSINFEGLEKLEIKAIPNEEGATIEILGNENLEDGENLITIIVTSADGNKIATYQIKANKLVVLEQVKKINMEAIVLSALISLVVLVIIIVLIVKYVKHNSMPVVDYEYNDNLENNKKEQDDINTEFSSEITPKEDIVEEKNIESIKIDETPIRRRKGKHSK